MINNILISQKYFTKKSIKNLLLGDGCVGIDEYRFDCVNRMAYKTLQELDDAYEKLLNVSDDFVSLKTGLTPNSFFSFPNLQDDDRKKGGITLERYQDLYAQFIAKDDETQSANFLFGPLQELD